MDFDNLHQVLRNLYQEMMPLCGDMIGVAKGIAGLGALFYVAYRVWKALANAEPIDVFPLLRPFAIGLCVMFFPTVVLGTINAVMSPVVQGTHAILEGQTLDLQAYQQQKDDLEAEARRREGKAWLVDDEVYEKRLADMGVRNAYACIASTDKDDEYLNHDSISFHEKQGYTLVGKFHKCAEKFGREYDMVWMEKIIG